MKNKPGRIRIVHTADIHLGSMFATFPARADILRQEHFDAFLSVIERCEREQVDLFLIAGDLFDLPDPSTRLARRVADALSILSATKVFIVSGNHDPASLDAPYRTMEWPENVKVFRGDPERVDLEDLGVSVYGAGFVSEAASEPLFGPDAPVPHPDGWIHLLLLHGDLVDEGAGSQYNPVRPSWLAGAGFDYVALGHRHAPLVGEIHPGTGVRKEVVPTIGNPLRSGRGTSGYAYSGCLVGRGFDETGVKGLLEVTLSREAPMPGDSGHRPVRIVTEAVFNEAPRPARRMIRLPVPYVSGEPAEETAERIKDAVEAVEGPSSRHIYRIDLTGPRTEDETVPLDPIRWKVRDIVFDLEIRDLTSIRRNREEWMRETSLRGAFVRRIQEKIQEVKDQEGGKEAVRLLECALDLGLAAVRGEVPDHAPD